MCFSIPSETRVSGGGQVFSLITGRQSLLIIFGGISFGKQVLIERWLIRSRKLLLTLKLGLITTPSILGPKSTANLGGVNPENSEKCLFRTHSQTGSSLTLVATRAEEYVGGGVAEEGGLLEEEEELAEEQFKDWARAVAAADGSETRAQGAWADPAIRMARWKSPGEIESINNQSIINQSILNH